METNDCHPCPEGHSFEVWIDALTAALIRARDADELSTSRAPADLAAALVDGFEGAVARSSATGVLDPLEVFLAVTLEELTR